MFAHLLTDYYKFGHRDQYPEGLEGLYTTWTPRNYKHMEKTLGFLPEFSMVHGIENAMAQLKDLWDDTFFKLPKHQVVMVWERLYKEGLGQPTVNADHWAELHDYGALPIHVKALPKGTLVRANVPTMTVQETEPKFAWIVEYLESQLSCLLWKPATVATIAHYYRKLLESHAANTGAPLEAVDFQAHDFSMRGMGHPLEAMWTGTGHLAVFKGTDNVASSAVELMRDSGNQGYSIPATEHSVATANIAVELGTPTPSKLQGLPELLAAELKFLTRLLKEVYPKGLFSYVADSYDYWSVLNSLSLLKGEILSREGKLVIRPDCYDDQTQVLTNSGWKFFKDLLPQDKVAQVNSDNSYTFVTPIKYVNQPYSGDMHRFYDHYGKVDLLVTPNHRMVLEQSGKERIVEAEKLKSSGNHLQKMYRSASSAIRGERLTPLERLKIAFQADGSFCTKMLSSIRFSFSKPRKIERLENLLSAAGLEHRKYDLKDGRVEFNIKVDATKFSKDFSWVPPIEEIGSTWAAEFIEELKHWDSSIRSDTRFKFDTTSKDVMDVVELVAVAAGKGIHISKTEDNRSEKFSDVYTAHIMDNNTIGGQAWKHSVEPYEGNVYCVQVPSGKLLVKRNKSILVCGNSGDPVRIVAGYLEHEYIEQDGELFLVSNGEQITESEAKGSIQVLWDIFGGTENGLGYKVLDEHIGLIYGDSITYDRADKILSILAQKGFASTNVVFGIGSYTYNYITRDTLGYAMKATHVTVNGRDIEIYKDPATGDGSKKSAKGLVRVDIGEDGELALFDQQTREEEKLGMLTTIYKG